MSPKNSFLFEVHKFISTAFDRNVYEVDFSSTSSQNPTEHQKLLPNSLIRLGKQTQETENEINPVFYSS